MTRRGVVAALSGGFGTAAVVGAGTIAYGVRATSQFTLRRRAVPVLAPGADPIDVLHLSDLHLIPTQRRKVEWIASLAELEPDLVVSTGDLMADSAALPTVLEALEGLLDVPGVFVLGSNDYYAPRAKNPLRYFARDPRAQVREERLEHLPTQLMIDSFTGRGWQDLTNARASLSVRGTRVEFVGVDDPHLDRDVMPAPDGSPAGQRQHGEALRVAVAHAPYRRVLDEFVADGADVIFAGHTHGGQIAFPDGTAIVTNCDLDRKRASGLHGWPGARPDHRGGEDSAWLHVSAGLGNSPFAPIRLFVPPEATLLTLLPRA